MKHEGAPRPKTRLLIKISCITGLFVVLLFAGVLIVMALRTKSGVFSLKNFPGGVSFVEKLHKFDEYYAQYTLHRRETNLELMLSLLDALEKTAVGAEGRLSVLKRWRLLVRTDSRFAANYRDAAARAAAQFPHSAALAGLAGEALLEADDNTAPAVAEKLAGYAQVLANAGPLAETSSLPLAFSFYALSGSLDSAASARAIPKIDELFLIGLRGLEGRDTEAMLVNAALLKIVDGSLEGAAAFLVPLNMGKPLSPVTRSFFANYAYDFGDPILAARLWTESQLPADIARAAGALALAGQMESAIQLWRLLAGSKEKSEAMTHLRMQSLYNIAAAAPAIAEKRAALEQLLVEAGGSLAGPEALYGTVLYSRLAGTERGAAILEEALHTRAIPLFDVELCRRRFKNAPLDKAIAETWLLIDRWSDEPFVYRWAAWYFDFQRSGDDRDFLLQTAERRGIRGMWMPLFRAQRCIRNADYPAALAILESIKPEDFPAAADESPEEIWPLYANEGLLLEARRDFHGALERFTQARAALAVRDNDFSMYPQNRRQSAAMLELRRAHCLSVLERETEARDAVRAAAALDPDNINVRVAQNRLGG